jgi:hypothetical protein
VLEPAGRRPSEFRQNVKLLEATRFELPEVDQLSCPTYRVVRAPSTSDKIRGSNPQFVQTP